MYNKNTSFFLLLFPVTDKNFLFIHVFPFVSGAVSVVTMDTLEGYNMDKNMIEKKSA
jgi:hypothetical protein